MSSIPQHPKVYRKNRWTSPKTALRSLFAPYRLYLNIYLSSDRMYDRCEGTYETGWPCLSLPYILPSLPKMSSGNISFIALCTSNDCRQRRVEMSMSFASVGLRFLREVVEGRWKRNKGQRYLALKNFMSTTLTRASLGLAGSMTTPHRVYGLDPALGSSGKASAKIEGSCD